LAIKPPVYKRSQVSFFFLTRKEEPSCMPIPPQITQNLLLLHAFSSAPKPRLHWQSSPRFLTAMREPSFFYFHTLDKQQSLLLLLRTLALHVPYLSFLDPGASSLWDCDLYFSASRWPVFSSPPPSFPPPPFQNVPSDPQLVRSFCVFPLELSYRRR